MTTLPIDGWMVAWTPPDEESYPGYPPPGSVKVGPWPDPDHIAWSDRYSCTDGCCWLSFGNLPLADQIAQMLIIQLAVIDTGIDSKAAHHEFMKICEYRKLIAARNFNSGLFEPSGLVARQRAKAEVTS